MAPLRVSTTKSEWLPDDPTAFVPTRLWKLPFITTWDDSRNQNRPTDSAEEAIELYHKRSDLEPADYQLQVQQIDDALTFHLRHRILKDDDNQTLLDGIGLHQDRGNLLRFLHVEGLEPTNNRAERALRPAVIARKVSHCSKNQRGAAAFSAFVSVIQTATQAGAQSTIAYLRDLFSPPASPSG